MIGCVYSLNENSIRVGSSSGKSIFFIYSPLDGKESSLSSLIGVNLQWSCLGDSIAVSDEMLLEMVNFNPVSLV